MQAILDFLNALPPAARDDFAQRCGTTVGYIRKAVSTRQKINAETCIYIERESRGVVTCEALRPDVDWSVLRNAKPKSAKTQARRAVAATENVAQGVGHV